MYSLSELQKIVADYMARLDVDGHPHSLYEPIAYSLSAGGKRLRPMLTVAACNIFSDNAPAALPAAAALEVFHTFTLLHDDIMDNAPVRRGKPSVYGKWGANSAILSGDAMMIYSYKLLQQTPVEYLPAVLGCFNYTALTVCEGQELDMKFESRDEVSMEEYLEMINKKTAALLAGATIIGAIQGGADPHSRQRLMVFATESGLAFQLQDDLLDAYGTEAQLGKPIGGDILEGKKSFLMLTALAKADSETKQALTALLNDKQMAAQEKIAAVLKIYDRLNVRELTDKEISLHFGKAMEALDNLAADRERTEPLRQLAEGLLNRKN
jgi:geranylgeranyl diphosphate synthase type II